MLKNGVHCIRAERHQFDVEGSGGLWLIECHNEGTKSLPVKAEYGSGLHRLDAKVEVHTTPPGIETCFSGNVWARDPFSLTHRLSACSDVKVAQSGFDAACSTTSSAG